MVWAPRQDSSLHLTDQSRFITVHDVSSSAILPAQVQCAVRLTPSCPAEWRDLDAMLALLRAAGVRIDGQQTEEGAGRFAWLADPEGNRVELWELAEDVLEPADRRR